MTLSIKLLDAAESEMADAIAWYEERETGLGTALREVIESTISAIQTNPLAYPVVKGSKVRRAVAKRFPYVIIYPNQEDYILIISIFHTSQNPLIWKGRLG